MVRASSWLRPSGRRESDEFGGAHAGINELAASLSSPTFHRPRAPADAAERFQERRPMRMVKDCRGSWLPLLFTALGGCATPTSAPAPAPVAIPAKLEDHVAIAQRELDRQLAAAKVADAKLRAEVELAQQKLEQFDRSDAPLRVAKMKLDLERSRDQLAEAQEELAELQMMYANADLADKTRDIVLHRSERRVVRQQEALDLAVKDLETLEQRTLPLERRRLELDLVARTADAEDGRRGAEFDELNKRAALRDASAELEKAGAK
jgi:hypothetical protein